MKKIYEPTASFHEEWKKYSVEEVLTWNKNHPHLQLCDNYIRAYCQKYKKDIKDIRLFDGGCGIGRLVVYYKRKGYKICGVDNVLSAVQKAKQYDPQLHVIHGYLRNLAFPNDSLDVYFSVGVIEHDINGPDGILKEANHILKKNGLLLINIPIRNNFYKIFWPLIRLYNFPFIENNIRKFFEKQPIHKKEFDYYLYDKHEFKNAILRNGFRIIKLQPTMHIPGVAKACPLFLNRGKNKDTTGNSIYFLNSIGRGVYYLTKPFKWFLPNCCFIAAEKI